MPFMQARTILILPRDAIIGSLMGELVTFCGHSARYPLSDETAAQALTRVQPDIVLVDADHDSASNGAFINAANARSRVIYFAGGRNDRELEQFATQRRALAFPLPNGPRRLEQTLAAALRL
ncbi:MAG: hypothetical protein ABJD07_04060 [Gemmatimonadaceae bacterium]